MQHVVAEQCNRGEWGVDLANSVVCLFCTEEQLHVPTKKATIVLSCTNPLMCHIYPS